MLIGLALSFTRFVIDQWKDGDNRDEVAKKLLRWNAWWFACEMYAALLLIIVSMAQPKPLTLCWFYLLLSIVAFWRINEVVYAFYADAMSKLRNELAKSSLKPDQRIRMLLFSFLGLIIQFAIMYFALSTDDSFSKPLGDFRDALYFSATVLLAIGQEGQEVKGQILRSLHIYEGAAGILLLVFAISIYIGKAKDADI